jgi:hypothetical protein
MDEMMEDVLAVEDDEELEAEADAEVDKVLFDLTDGKLGQAGAARTEAPVRIIISIPNTRLADCSHRQQKTQWMKQKWRERWSNTAPSSTACSARPYKLIRHVTYIFRLLALQRRLRFNHHTLVVNIMQWAGPGRHSVSFACNIRE